jgi:hypothetical protein
MIVAAALCPCPPLLARPVTGRDPVLPPLREACAEAARRLVAAGPGLIAVVGPGPRTRDWPPGSRLDLSVFAPALGRGGDPALPAPLGLGAMLLDQAGYRGRRVLSAVAPDEPPEACAGLGARLGASAARVGLLAMGDGSARRSRRAPGQLDERAAGFDAETERALRQGDTGALLAIGPALARELLASGRPVWQALAGALRRPGQPAATAAEILYADAPFGVAYTVAFLEAAPGAVTAPTTGTPR